MAHTGSSMHRTTVPLRQTEGARQSNLCCRHQVISSGPPLSGASGGVPGGSLVVQVDAFFNASCAFMFPVTTIASVAYNEGAGEQVKPKKKESPL